MKDTRQIEKTAKFYGFDVVVSKVMHSQYADILGPYHRCGYVGIPQGHPLYGVHYNDIQASIHGGLTYSDEEWPDNSKWWVGFDCAHSGDTVEKWTLKAVLNECKELARQLKEQA